MLGVGALTTIFMVVASIYDNTADYLDEKITDGEREARAWAREVMWFAALTISFILILGYRVGAGVVHRPVSFSWWVIHTVALLGPTVVVLGLDRYRRRASAPLSPAARRARRAVAIFLVATRPALLTVSIITAGPDSAATFNLTVISAVAATYYGLGAAAMLRLISGR